MASHETNQTILVVDDDAEIREVLATTLAEEGYPVQTAMNGRDALQVMDQIGRPAMILLDLTMPVLDGAGFLAQLEQRPQADVPVVIVSAVGHRVAQRGALVVDKPIDLEQLLGYVRRYCGPAVV